MWCLAPSSETRAALKRGARNAEPGRRRPHPPLLSPPRARKSKTAAEAEAAAAEAAAAEDAEDDAPLAELSRRRAAVVFSSPTLHRAALLARREIDSLFADARVLDTRRLLDPFYVPDQYNLLRTQPGALLGAEAATALSDALVEFGETHLGLNAITPPWISFYLDGMSQEMHVDAFQGPLAFVMPLSYWGDEEEEEEEGEDGNEEEARPRLFRGGETAILRHGVLRYWDDEEVVEADADNKEAPPPPTTTTTRATPVDLSGGAFRSNGAELDHLFARVPPRFGRLLVFDGRLPHGVRPVRCPTSDPRDARIALHAWFAPPGSFFFGGALADDDRQGSKSSTAQQRKKAHAVLDAAVRALTRELSDDCPPAKGLLTTRLAISGETGEVEGVSFLADTLVVSPSVCADGGIGEREARALIQHVVAGALKGVRFPATVGTAKGRGSGGEGGSGGGASTATVPLLFD